MLWIVRRFGVGPGEIETASAIFITASIKNVRAAEMGPDGLLFRLRLGSMEARRARGQLDAM